MSRISLKEQTLCISDMTNFVSDTQDMTKNKAKALVECFRDAIVENLLCGKSVSIFGLGILELREKKGKIGRNPKTGEPVKIPAGRKVRFRASKSIKDKL